MSTPESPRGAIAIIGIGCRFPESQNADDLWDIVRRGQVTFRDVPTDRWNHEMFFSPNQRDIDKAWVKRGSFVEGYREFAAMHFGIAPRRLEVMDPQQRLLIEATRLAIQDAGYECRDFARGRTGTYMGISTSEFRNFASARLLAQQFLSGDFGAAAGSEALRDAVLDMVSHVAPLRAFSLSGSLTALNAAAIAQTFDFGGPAFTMDAACASASIAVHNAVTQLRAGLIDCAMAGGAYINLGPDNLVSFTRIGAISPSGVCRPFEARSDGFVQSDGIAVLFLKRYEDALRDGDRVYAKIIGSGCNNDGRGEGPMTPRVKGQLEVLRAAYDDAQVCPSTVQYFEAHGTATSIGDPVEVEALGTLLRDSGRDTPAWLGSIKGNIGHAMSAAGAAGLIKAVKLLESGTVPPQPDFGEPHPAIRLAQWPLSIAQSADELQASADAPARAAVSSFGFGGTNSHIVLEAAEPSARAAAQAWPGASLSDPTPPEAVVLSAPTLPLLSDFAEKIAADVMRYGTDHDALASVARTLNSTRQFERYRLVVVADTLEGLRAQLVAAAEKVRQVEGSSLPLRRLGRGLSLVDPQALERADAAPRLCFLFPGQGAQRVGMGRALVERYPTIAAHLAQLGHLAAGDAGERHVQDYLYPEASDADTEAALRATSVCQPAMAAFQLAVAAYLSSLGVSADVSLGHSLGEFIALANAGALDPAATVELLESRGRAMEALELSDPGAMAAVFAPKDAVVQALEGIDDVVVANHNQPRQVSISGTTPGVAAACEHLQAQGIKSQPLNVSHAFHSPLLGGVNEAMATLLEAQPIEAPQHRVVSCIEASVYAPSPAGIRSVLTQHATRAVRFAEALEVAAEDADIFVQVGGGRMLTGFAKATLGDAIPTIELHNKDDDGGASFIEGLALLGALDARVDFDRVYQAQPGKLIALPETPLERAEYWILRDRSQPRPKISLPLPGESVPTTDVAAAATNEGENRMTKSTEPTADAAVVALFREQNALLKQYADILSQQTAVLSGATSPGASAEALGAAAQALAAAGPTDSASSPTPASDARTPESSARAEASAGSAPPAQDDRSTVDEAARQRQVLEIVARVSAFPLDKVHADQKLVDDLGFDSLMVADLVAALEKEVPNAGQLSEASFDLSTTVGDIVASLGVSRPGSATKASDDDARPVALEELNAFPWEARIEAPLAVSRHNPDGECWLVTEDGRGFGEALSAHLKSLGAQVIRVRLVDEHVAAPAQLRVGTLNLWSSAFVEGIGAAIQTAATSLGGWIHASALDGGKSSDVAGLEQLHLLASGISAPRISVLFEGCDNTHPLAGRAPAVAAYAGYLKALQRERPGTSVKVAALQGLRPSDAAAILDELLIRDGASEVAMTSDRRYVPAVGAPETLSSSTAQNGGRAWASDDCVLITGGMGYLGQAIAAHAAQQNVRQIILVGRSPENASTAEFLSKLSALGPTATYLSLDLAHGDDLMKAIRDRQLPSPTVVVHSAGVLRDGLASTLSVDDLRSVLAAKVAVFDALQQGCPDATDFILCSSWAGFFGNAGQSNYSAANAYLNQAAISQAPAGTRYLSIAWPPLHGSGMVATIGSSVQKMMAREGVPFVALDAAVALFDRLFRHNTSGCVVVGTRPPVDFGLRAHEEAYTLTNHPYLDDHRLKGRGIVPLAAVVDQATWLGGLYEACGLSMTDFELRRPLVLGDRAEFVLQGNRFEARNEKGDVCYRARCASLESARLGPAPQLEGDAIEVPSPEAFYRDHTFHGPMFQTVRAVSQATTRGIRGTVDTSALSEWLPSSQRTGWAMDPGLIDGCFQLAAIWLQARHQRIGYPTGFERLQVGRILSPADGPFECTAIVEDVDEKGFRGDLYCQSSTGEVLAVFEGIQGRFAEGLRDAPVPPTSNQPIKVAAPSTPEENYRIEAFPEVEQLDQRFQMAEAMGLKNPYFSVHAGTARNTSVVDGREMLNYSSYNYLGFSGHPEVVEAAQKAIEQYGTSVSASRIASGERPLHRDLETGLAKHIGVDDTIVYVSGHATNVTTIGHLFDRHDLIVHDALIHDSILQGIYLSGATRRPYPHEDMDALNALLEQVRGQYRRVLICAEGIYSMDGDACDLPRLIEIKKRHKALLLVDEAHSNGVLGPAGRGVAHHYDGVNPRDVDIWMGTLSKSFASCGGWIGGSHALVRYLKYTAPGFVYSAGITPPNAAAGLKSLELMHQQPELVETLRARSKLFLDLAKAEGIDTGPAIGAAVVPAIVGDSLKCMKLSEVLAGRGINVQPIVYPAVENDAARLRFFISAVHTEDEIRHTVRTLAEELRRLNQPDTEPSEARI